VLRPKSHKDFKESIAQKVGVHPDVVDDFITFYYAKLRKNLSDLTFPSITVYGLGTFHIRRKILNKTIKKNKSILGNLVKNTYNGYEKHISVTEKLLMFENAKNMMDEIAQEKKDFKLKKNETKRFTRGF
jgi:hypothetical protein